MAIRLLFTLFIFLRDVVVAAEIKVMEGDSLTLNTDVTKQQHDKILWYFNDTRIALINGEASKSCLYDGEGGRFRDRLKVDYESGSLTITSITAKHTGVYEAELIRRESAGISQSLNRKPKCDGTKVTQKMSTIGETIKTYFVSVSVSQSRQGKAIEELNTIKKEHDSNSFVTLGLIGVFVGVLPVIAVIVGVIYFCRRASKNVTEEKNIEHLLKI
ncbi:uncharacterized protein LOC130216138 isoform X2 [Danio aesculapii]|uniref:uncharacterized protein LOC130216138 isoform X2 n=1 Tax=Danio aesculapii TaxID=1142201 RepID=UPI0024BF8D2F|nr:uncharacterized protein LOC130216138 isoform X2 [Danio aesculapii]